MVIIRYENINDWVLELCEERGWSNHELMNKSGIDEDTLRNILEKKVSSKAGCYSKDMRWL